MSVTVLFGNQGGRGQQNKNLVEFKAGKMSMNGNMVHPDKRKGLVYVFQSDDSLMHFCWKDRTTGVVEDDLIIFPEDVEFKRVTQCTTGRVFILKFKSRKLFFWMQEAKTDKDEEYCRKINEFLNNPPSLGSSQRSGGVSPERDLQNLLSKMSQQQLMQLFGGPIGGLSNLLGTMSQSPRTGGTTTTTSTTAPSPSTGTSAPAASSVSTPQTPSTPVSSTKPTTPTAPKKAPSKSDQFSNPIQLSQLQNYLSGLVGQQQPGGSGVDLSTSLNQESLQAVLNNPELVRELQRHLPSVGSDEDSQEQLRNTLSSPQFQQALSMFSTALQSGQLGPVVSQFGVPADAVSAANQGNMEDFVRALQAATISCQESADKEEKKEAKKDDDDEMNLD